MTLVNQARKWGKLDDEKLFRFFESGEVDPANSEKDYIESIRLGHFSWCIYKNFSINYRNKAREFTTNQALAGARGKMLQFFVWQSFNIS
jgi:hypothetical protein